MLLLLICHGILNILRMRHWVRSRRLIVANVTEVATVSRQIPNVLRVGGALRCRRGGTVVVVEQWRARRSGCAALPSLWPITKIRISGEISFCRKFTGSGFDAARRCWSAVACLVVTREYNACEVAQSVSPCYHSRVGVSSPQLLQRACCRQHPYFATQVMPHLLHFLGIEAAGQVWDAEAGNRGPGARPTPRHSGDCMDWGTLAVYTCPASCPTGAGRQTEPSSGTNVRVDGKRESSRVLESYVEEFVWRQPPP